jgi:CRISPR-associated protein Csm2
MEAQQKQSSELISNLTKMSSKICEEYTKYKGVYQKYVEAKKKDKINKLDHQVKERAEYYERFLLTTIKAVNNYGFSEKLIKIFLEPKGIAEAIASTITFKPTQLRKIFHQLKTIKQSLKGKDKINGDEVHIIKILPLLAYSKGRNLISEDFYELIKALISKVRESGQTEDFSKFVDIFEAIVAYHKYYNPKEN